MLCWRETKVVFKSTYSNIASKSVRVEEKQKLYLNSANLQAIYKL